jgi:hypothetical protein
MKIDHTNQRFTRLTVLQPAPPQGGRSAWIAVCDCGNHTVALAKNLVAGITKSCGCLRLDSFIETVTKHGLCGHPLYKTWQNMLQRCTNPNSQDYVDYGGRGITVCERWHSFDKFLEDMGEKPSPAHTLERRRNCSGYSPSNCVWATRIEQASNKRPISNTTGWPGVRQQGQDFVARHRQVPLGKFSTAEQASWLYLFAVLEPAL